MNLWLKGFQLMSFNPSLVMPIGHKGLELKNTLLKGTSVRFTLWILTQKWYRQNVSLEKKYFALLIKTKLGKKEILKSYIVLLRAELNCKLTLYQVPNIRGMKLQLLCGVRIDLACLGCRGTPIPTLGMRLIPWKMGYKLSFLWRCPNKQTNKRYVKI